VGGRRAGSQIWVMVSAELSVTQPLLTTLGITPKVDPEDLRFYFEEIHRLTRS
jgi:hypothetical protein